MNVVNKQILRISENSDHKTIRIVFGYLDGLGMTSLEIRKSQIEEINKWMKTKQ